ncbi:protein adenylyltransferase SelO-like [Asterias amurensis]|uniref:protein adenylyltransferase SelO-like n=1 Tax=Asterias amurensis TaxID=7602 RepID=UPI003AB532AD
MAAPMKSTNCATKQTCFWVIFIAFSVTSTRHEDCKTDEYLHGKDKYSRNEPNTKVSHGTSSKTPCELSSSRNANHDEDDIDDISRANQQQRVALVSTFSDWHFDERQLLIETFPLDDIEENYIRQVSNVVFSKVFPSPMKTRSHIIALSEEVASGILDLHPDACNSEFFTAFVTGNTFLSNSVPLSHRYGGHQFGSWSGQLGDGRAVLLGEYVNSKGERWELQLKGSGLTPYSRRGDGRAVLRSSIREFLCSEAMYHLGIPTSRAVSLSVSSDPVWRDQFYDGHPKQEKAAVVLRLAPSWFRIGSLEILAKNQEIALLRKLTDFLIAQYFAEVDMSDADRYLAFFSEVVSETASMIAKWMSVGFAHGVMNTDNFSLLSLTIDYGPFGFLDSYIPEFVPNTSDDEALYSYEKQPDVAYFNLNKLRIALLPLVTKQQSSQLGYILEGYQGIYKICFMQLFRKKLGLTGVEEVDEYIIGFFLKLMQDTSADFTMTFHQLGALSLDNLSKNEIPESLWALKDLQQHERFSDWIQDYTDRARRAGGETRLTNREEIMNAVNPRYILRNWMAHEAIQKAEGGDYSKLHLLQTVLKTPYKVQDEAERALFAQRPPQWASKIRVSCSS